MADPTVPNFPVSFLSELRLLFLEERLSATEYLSLLVKRLGTERLPWDDW